jgi:hypothetical protein
MGKQVDLSRGTVGMLILKIVCLDPRCLQVESEEWNRIPDLIAGLLGATPEDL